MGRERMIQFSWDWLIGMSDVAMAPDAGEPVVFGGSAGVNIVSEAGVAPPAGIFRDGAAAGLHGNGLMEIAGGKSIGMPEAMVGFGPVFSDHVVRGVAVVAGRHGAMAGFDPRIVVVLHDMAVRAGLRVVGEIRTTTRIDKGVTPDAGGEPEQDSGGNGSHANSSAGFHLSPESTASFNP